jgi:DnaJ-class molecular chaperone
MTLSKEPEPVLDLCDACGGTGIEEGREWDGYRCAECKGRGLIVIDGNEEYGDD